MIDRKQLQHLQRAFPVRLPLNIPNSLNIPLLLRLARPVTIVTVLAGLMIALTATLPGLAGGAAAWAAPAPIAANQVAANQVAANPTAAKQVTASQSVKPYLDRVAKNVTEFRLKNGMKFIVLERHKAPIVSFMTYANVGGADEPDGQTGVAHFLEHLAFKGTTQIGTTNYAAEKPIFDRMDALKPELDAAKKAKDEPKLIALRQELRDLEKQALPLVKQNEFGRIVEQAGGVGLNAATSSDATMYFYSFPANKLELWMSLESDRFLDPVFREFYKEQDVILEERRMRTENSPVGRAVEALLDKAYDVHPYRRPVIGYDEDIRGLTRPNVRDFFNTYYGPGNLTVAIVGDVKPQEVRRLAETYFGRFPAKAQPPRSNRREPPQTAPREVTLRLDSQPWYFEAYHAPAMADPDYVIYTTLSSLLSDGRTSRLYKSLVEEKQVALSAQGFMGFPGDRYPTLLLFYALTAPGKTVDDLAAVLDQELTRIKQEPVAIADLERIKTQARADRLRQLTSNSRMASILAEYDVKTGDWRNAFTEIDRLAAITPADIQRVAQATFRPENRTVLKLLSK